VTFRQVRELGGHVCKGERGETVVYADTFIRSEIDPDSGEEVECGIPRKKPLLPGNIMVPTWACKPLRTWLLTYQRQIWKVWKTSSTLPPRKGYTRAKEATVSRGVRVDAISFPCSADVNKLL